MLSRSIPAPPHPLLPPPPPRRARGAREAQPTAHRCPAPLTLSALLFLLPFLLQGCSSRPLQLTEVPGAEQPLFSPQGEEKPGSASPPRVSASRAPAAPGRGAERETPLNAKEEDAGSPVLQRGTRISQRFEPHVTNKTNQPTKQTNYERRAVPLDGGGDVGGMRAGRLCWAAGSERR